MCGSILDAAGERVAFVRSTQGEFTLFAFPGSTLTQCRGINAAGQMVGVHRTPDNKLHGFVKDGDEYLSIDVPGAIDTRGFGIDPSGQIVGKYVGSDGRTHGYLFGRDGFVTIDVPGAVATEASGIMPDGRITGVYQTPDTKFHGYILSGNGFEPVDVPGAVSTGSANGGLWMSSSGELAGYYPQALGSSLNRAFLRLGDETFESYLYPGSVDTCFFGINERGDIVGFYRDAALRDHGLFIQRQGRRPPGQ